MAAGPRLPLPARKKLQPASAGDPISEAVKPAGRLCDQFSGADCASVSANSGSLKLYILESGSIERPFIVRRYRHSC